jgi:transposase
MKQVDTIPSMLARRSRRRHSADFKRQVVEACCEPGVSIAGVALAHGLNANMVRRWLNEHGVTAQRRQEAVQARLAMPSTSGEFVPVSVEPGSASATEIRIEIRRGASTVTISWPHTAAGECAAWLRDWPR